MALDLTQPFQWGAGGAPMTPQAAEAQRKVAQALLMQGMDYSPVRSPWQGAARVAQALVGGFESAQADASDKKLAEMQPQMLAAALTGAVSPTQPIASGTAAPMGATSIPSGTIDPRLSSAISTAASANNVDPAYMTRLALVENGGKVEGGSTLSSAQGPFQFLSGTARQYGLTNPNDPASSADAAARLTLDNKVALTSALGREPTPGELYLAHQQGVSGAIKLLQNPNAPVESVIGAQAARNNAATPGMTAGQFANKWMGRFGDIVQTVDPAQKNIIDAQADAPAAPMAFAGTQPTAGAPVATAAPVAPAAIPATPQPAQSASMAKIAPLISLASSPYASPATKQIAGVLLSSQLSAIQKANDPMRALDMQTKTLAIQKAQQDLNKPEVQQFKMQDGTTRYGYIDRDTQQPVFYKMPEDQAGGAAGDFATAVKNGVTGDDLYKFIPPDQANTVKGMIEGRIPPPNATARSSPRTLQLLNYASAIDPSFDATTWKSRSTFNQQFGSQAPSSIGGQKVLMGTALGHLGEVADSAAKLNNVNGLGIAKVGHFANYVKNQTTDQAAIANALEDKVAKFSGEVGKLYSGSQGGGVHEREDTRNRLGSNLTAAELAAGLEASKDLILSKQKALADQASTIFGPERSQKFDFIGPEGRDAIAKIDNAITKLRGQEPGASAAPSANGQRKTSTGISWSVQ